MKIHGKFAQNPPKFDPKWRKSVQGGTPKRRQEEKMKKIVGVPNSPVVFSAILEENWSQDGGQNQAKIYKNVFEKTNIFCLSFEGHVGAILVRKWYQNPSKNGPENCLKIYVRAARQNLEK